MSTMLRGIFDPLGDLENQRSKYLSRLFGIFSERIVAHWANDERAPYENLGRPTLKTSEDTRGHTLDFTFRCRSSGRSYASEMKCEIEYQNFKYFVLERTQQLDHHRKPAFEAFLGSARYPEKYAVRIKGNEVEIDGAILVWGAVSSSAKSEVMSDKGFHDILSIEEICQDLVTWRNPEYLEMIEQYRAWSNRLFDGLISANSPK